MDGGGGGWGTSQESPARVRKGGGGILLGHGSWHLPGGRSSHSTTVGLEEPQATWGASQCRNHINQYMF